MESLTSDVYFALIAQLHLDYLHVATDYSIQEPDLAHHRSGVRILTVPSFHVLGLSLSERASVSNESLAKNRLLSVLSWLLRQVPGVLRFCGSKCFSSVFEQLS